MQKNVHINQKLHTICSIDMQWTFIKYTYYISGGLPIAAVGFLAVWEGL